jgi:hypothetical protein
MPLEKNLRDRMIRYIKALPVPSHARAVPASMSGAGQPDIDAVIDGLALKIEVKLPGNTPTERQHAVIRQWGNAGAVAGWCDNMDDFKILVRKTLERRGCAAEEIDKLLK